MVGLGVLEIVEPAFELQRDVDTDNDHQDLEQEVAIA